MSEPKFTETVESLRDEFNSGITQSLSYRKGQLKALATLLTENREALADALFKDFRKPRLEAMASEIDYAYHECVDMTRNFKKWAKPNKVEKNFLFLLSSARVRKQPLGVVLIIGPWNYPFQLVVTPLIGAIAAGNCCVVKPSELAPHTAQLLAALLPRYLDPRCYAVVQGGADDTRRLLLNRFDYIFYTGGTAVGKLIMEAASKHLTPVTLELGGKTPTYVDSDVNLKMAVQRIAWGKFLNAGQTCVAPDYVLCERSQVEPLVAQLQDTLRAFYGGSASGEIRASPDFARIINDRHYSRLVSLLTSTRGEVVCGGAEGCDPQERYVPPTVVVRVGRDDPLMQDELFGPILPILPVSGVDEAIAYINSREKPLALYAFSNSRARIRRIRDATSSGSFVSNDVMMQGVLMSLPFGGVGHSGMGAYHREASFLTFSHRRSCLDADRGAAERGNAFRYPPYNEKKIDWARRLIGMAKY